MIRTTRAPISRDNDERMEPVCEPGIENIVGFSAILNGVADRLCTWTIPRYRDLYGYSRGQILFRAGDTNEHVVEARWYNMSTGADARGVTIIFSLEIEATYDALASSCVVRDLRRRDANLLA